MQCELVAALYSLLYCAICPKGYHGRETISWECLVYVNVFGSQNNILEHLKEVSKGTSKVVRLADLLRSFCSQTECPYLSSLQ